MAKAKILADRISITSDILTDENIEKVSILSPSTLYLYDDKDESRILYQVTGNEFNTFTKYGATFKDGKSLGAISEESMVADDKESKVKNELTAILTRIDRIEEQVSAYLEVAEDLSDDIEFLD